MKDDIETGQAGREMRADIATPLHQPDVIPGDEHVAGQSTRARLDRSRIQYPGRLTPEQRDLRVQARAEQRVGKVLDRLARVGVRTLHDRRLPYSAGQVDHVVIAGSGIYLVNTVAIIRRHPTEWIGGRLCIGGRTLAALAHFSVASADEIARTIARDFDEGWTIVVFPIIAVVGAPVELHVDEGVEVVGDDQLASRILYRQPVLDQVEIALLTDAAARACPPAV